MTLTQLETFMRIAERKNFTSAANELGYAQSTVTMQIKQLEDELGSLLFDRLGKTIVLTSSGERLMLYADRLLQIEREIHLEVPESGEPSGVLKLGVSESLCYNRLPDILMKYKERFPKVEMRLQFITHDIFPDLLKKGELDLVYTLNPLMEDENLNLLYTNPETLGFYASSEHPLAKKKAVNEEDLKDIPLLLTSHNCSFRHMLLNSMEQAGVYPNIVLETTAKEILKQFAANNLGIAFMPDMVAEDEVKRKVLKRLKWTGADFPIFSQIFIHKDKHGNKMIREFVDMVSAKQPA
jgi:DNA-binding transcriptional LysR family regulator